MGRFTPGETTRASHRPQWLRHLPVGTTRPNVGRLANVLLFDP
jgi:hypothetical protein